MAGIRDEQVDILDDQVEVWLAAKIRTALLATPEAVRDVAWRAERDFNRIPWPSAFLAAFDQLPGSAQEDAVRDLKEMALAASDVEARGAAILLLGIAERRPVLRDFLKTVSQQRSDEFTRYLIGGYLRSYGFHPEEGAAEAVLETSVPYEPEGGPTSRAAWQRLLGEWTLYRETVRQLLATVAHEPGVRSELRSGFLTAYDAADVEGKRSLRMLLAELLLTPDGPEREFAFDFLFDPDIRTETLADFAPRLTWGLLRLARQEGHPLRQMATAVMERVKEDDMERRAVFLGARGDLSRLSPRDRGKLYDIYVEERDRAGSFDASAVVDQEAHPHFGPDDWAAWVWSLTHVVPVPLDQVAGQLGIVVRRERFETAGFDSCLIRAADLPFFIAVVNETSGNERRQRFSLAHEIGHAVLPAHRSLAYACAVQESAPEEPERQFSVAAHEASAAEREADAFAAALLLPTRALQGDAAVELEPGDLDELADKYLVSYTALVFRLIPLSPANAAAFLSRDGNVVLWKRSRAMDIRVRGLGRLNPASLAHRLFTWEGARAGEALTGEVSPEAWFDADSWRSWLSELEREAPGDLHAGFVVYEASRLVDPGAIVTVVEVRGAAPEDAPPSLLGLVR